MPRKKKVKTAVRARAQKVAQRATRGAGKKPNKWDKVKFKELESFRLAHGLSQVEMAERLQVTGSTYFNWKAKKCAPNAGMQDRLRDFLDQNDPEGKIAAQAPRVVERTRAPRGAGSQTLSKLKEDSQRLTVPVMKEESPKGKKTKKKKKAEKKPGKTKKSTKAKAQPKNGARKPARAKKKPEEPVDGNGHPKWAHGVVESYLENNPVRTLDDLERTLSTVKKVLD